MTWPSRADQHDVVLEAEQGLTHPLRIPVHSHEKPDWHCGWALYLVQLALLTAVWRANLRL